VDERRWVYYSLTTTGRHLVENEKPRLTLVWASLLSIATVSAGFVAWRVWYVNEVESGSWGMNYVNLAGKPELWTTPTIVAALVLAGALAGAVWFIGRAMRAPTNAPNVRSAVDG
jgi:hypothetical protein